MMQNQYLLTKIGFDTIEKEPSKILTTCSTKPEFMYTESAYMFWREGKGKEDSISESAVRRAV